MAKRFLLKPEAEAERPVLTLDYGAALNGPQFEAVTAGGGPILVIAGAGTGKTRTLVYRVAYLVETGIKPEQIVLLTFTRRAAREMLSRATGLLDGRCDRVQGGTFHAFCLQILKRYASRIGYPETFTILDSGDAADVIDVLRTARGLHKAKVRFPRKGTLRDIFSSMANRRLSLVDVLDQEYPQFLIHLEPLRDLHLAYEETKRKHGLMDYDDLLAQTLRLFEVSRETLTRVAGECRHVLVDEYQDTNRLQADLVERFSAVHGNCMAVGDDAQSIYRFRGADARNIFEFPDRFAGARIITLEQNYRSTQPILDLANHVIAQAGRKYEKRLFTERTSSECPAFVQAPDVTFESRFVCQMILQLREEGIPLNRMAVLFRSGHNSFALELALTSRKIPFVKYGGVKLSEAAHIKDVVAFLKVLENARDVVAWNRVLQLIEGVGPRTAGEIIDWIVSAEDPLAVDRAPAGGRHGAELGRLAGLLTGLRDGGAAPAKQVEAVVAYYEPILERVFYEDVEKRRQDLERFAALAANYTSRARLLEDLALDPLDLTAVDSEAVDKDEAPLVLSTIHSAKGLEYDTVFLIQALDGVLPSSYALEKTEELDEELRLLYVALTRAENRLFISYPVLQEQRGFGDYFTKPTRFLEGVPELLLEPWTLVEESASADQPNSEKPKT